jgi:hypothetical protein
MPRVRTIGVTALTEKSDNDRTCRDDVCGNLALSRAFLAELPHSMPGQLACLQAGPYDGHRTCQINAGGFVRQVPDVW